MTVRLFTLQLDHGWYADGRLRGWTLEPCAETSAMMRRQGLQWHAGDAQFSLFAAGPGEPAAYLDALARAGDDAPLRLRLKGDPQHFASITELAPGGCRMPNFSSACGLDATSSESGGPVRHMLALPETAGRPGEVLLHPSDLSRALPHGQWRIGFSARSLPWLYYIINRGQFPLNQPALRRDDGLCLGGPDPTILANGEPALRFDSGDVKLPLEQSGRTRFGLYDRMRCPLSAQSAEICVMRTLPVPGPGALAWRDTKNRRGICAAVHVYL